MSRTTKTTLYAVALAALSLLPSAAHAQGTTNWYDFYIITLKNETGQCAWITISGPPGGKGILGTLGSYEQIKGPDRDQTGPMWVKGGASKSFKLPMKMGYRVRAEVQKTNGCSTGVPGGSDVAGGTIFDTNTTFDPTTGPSSANISLKKGTDNYYLDRK